jgi:hypothetical protein
MSLGATVKQADSLQLRCQGLYSAKIHPRLTHGGKPQQEGNPAGWLNTLYLTYANALVGQAKILIS